MVRLNRWDRRACAVAGLAGAVAVTTLPCTTAFFLASARMPVAWAFAPSPRHHRPDASPMLAPTATTPRLEGGLASAVSTSPEPTSRRVLAQLRYNLTVPSRRHTALDELWALHAAGERIGRQTLHAALAACSHAAECNGTVALALFRGVQRRAELSPDPETYALVMRTCVKTAMWRESLALFAELQGEAGAFCPALATTPAPPCERAHLGRVCQYAIHAAEKLSDWRSSWATYTAAQQKCISLPWLASAAVMRTCVKAQRWEEAVATVDDALYNLTAAGLVTANIAMRACAQAGRPDKAQAIFRRLPAARLRPNGYSYLALMTAFARAGLSEQALALLTAAEQQGGSALTLRLFNSAIHACGQSGNHLEALAVLARAQEAGFEPSTITLHTMMTVCATAGDVNRTLEFFGEVLLRDVAPHKTTLNKVLCEFAKRGLHQGALEMLRLMSLNGVPLDDVAFGAVLTACSKARQHEHVLDVYGEMRQCGRVPTDTGYSMVLQACEQTPGGWDAAVRVVRGAARHNRATLHMFARTLALVARQGKAALAVQLFDEADLLTRGLVDEACTAAVVTAHFKAGDAVGARRFLELFQEQERPIDVRAVTSAVSAWRFEPGGWVAGMDTYQRFVDNGGVPNVVLCNAALHLLSVAARPHHRSSADRAALAQAADKVLSDMSRFGVEYDVGTFTSIMACHWSLRQWADVRATWLQLNATDLTQSSAALLLGARACALIGDSAGAVDVLRAGLAMPAADELFLVALTACGRGTRFEAPLAMSLLQIMHERADLSPSLAHYRAALHTCRLARAWTQALQVLHAMLARDVQPDAPCYNEVLLACVRCGKWEMALQLWQVMVRSGVAPDHATRHACVLACQQGGLWREALDMLESREGAAGPKTAAAAVRVVAMLHEASQHALAVRTYRRFLEPRGPVSRTSVADCGVAELDLRHCSTAVAATAVRSELFHMRDRWRRTGHDNELRGLKLTTRRRMIHALDQELLRSFKPRLPSTLDQGAAVLCVEHGAVKHWCEKQHQHERERSRGAYPADDPAP